jgi:hypothetical protein
MKSQSEQRREEAKKILEAIDKAGRMYWLAVLVKSGALLESEAGFLLMNWEGLK